MFKNIFLVAALTFTLASCSKSVDPIVCTYTESTLIAPASEIAYLQAWVTTNRPLAIQHSSGIFYEIVTPGTGTVTPAPCKTITVKYTGWLLNGVQFDQNLLGAQFVLGGLIVGWQKGVPLIKKGGTIYLYVPPTLAYGSGGTPTIPPNSYIKFSIELVDVQ